MNRALVERLEKLEAHTTGKLVLVWCNHPDDFPAEMTKRIAAGTVSATLSASSKVNSGSEFDGVDGLALSLRNRHQGPPKLLARADEVIE